MIPYSLATVSLSILTYLLLVLMGSTCLSEAFRGQQVLLNHAKQKRKGGSFLSPGTKEKRKAESKKLALIFFEMFPLAIICFFEMFPLAIILLKSSMCCGTFVEAPPTLRTQERTRTTCSNLPGLSM